MKNFLVLILLLPVLAFGQSSQEQFGKNRLQWKKFDWKYLSTKNFNIYYYSGGNEVAHNAARYAEDDFVRITDMIGFVPYKKTTLIIYNSINDLQQSNIDLQRNTYAGGETSLIKSKIEIAFTGNQNDFKNEVTSRVTELLINIMMFGGNFKDMVQNSYLLSLPEWFVKGAARYVAQGWSPEMHDAVVDVISGSMDDPDKLTGQDAEIVGQSIWNYIASEFGASSISSILNYTRIVRNEESSISASLGVTYDGFLNNWKKFYETRIEKRNQPYEVTPVDQRVKKINRRRLRYNQIVFNDDSSIVAYSQNHQGRFSVFLYNYISKKRTRIFTSGIKYVDQVVDYNLPLMAWRSPVDLSVMYYRKGRPYILTKNIVTGAKEKKLFVTFDEILSFEYSPVSTEMVFSAVKKGQSDIFVYNYRKDKAKRITRDLYDDFDPTYVKGTNRIVFSSNRLSDTLRVDIGRHDKITGLYNLFSYDMDVGGRVLKRLTASYSVESRPIAYTEDDIYFLSERNNTVQLHWLNQEKGKAIQVSDFDKSIRDFGISKDKKHMMYWKTEKGKDFLYHVPLPDLTRDFGEYSIFSYGHKYEELVNDRKASSDQLLDNLMHFDIKKQKFDSDSSDKQDVENALDKLLSPQNRRLKIYGPYFYQGLFGADLVVTSLMVDPLRGTGGLFEVGMSEMFGNHRLTTRVFALTDLKSSSFEANYELLTGRNDYFFNYEKKSIFAIQEDAVHRYRANNFEALFSHPFSVSTRAVVGPIYSNARFTEFDDTQDPDVMRHYGGLKAELVHDNTKQFGLNMLEGTRAKALFVEYRGLNGQDLGFRKFMVDARHYLKVLNEITFAVRGSFGQFGGNSPKNFLLGGMDNWLFSQSEFTGENDPLFIGRNENNSDLLYIDYATNLRGFDFNKMFGPKYMLFSAELRLPITKLLYDGPVSSSFFRNLQAIAFYDMGSAWSGKSPFGRDNSINTKPIGEPGDPFTGTVTNYQNPFLSGYGLGVRSMLLNYYMKLDVAWGVENYVVLPARFYLTFGHDF